MNKILLVLIIFLPFAGLAQPDTVYYFGINGKTQNIEKQEIMKRVDFLSAKKAKVKTYKSIDGEWLLIYTEKIKMESDSVYEIRMKGDEFSGRVTRKFEPQKNGVYKFTDYIGATIKRSGFTKSKIPLLFEGSVTEYYQNGKIKFVAEYKENELITNKNWLPDGTPLVDNIFYSADSEPRFEPGMAFMHQQIRQTIKDSKFDLLTVEGRVVVGLVITKEGKIDGIQIVKGISQDLNGILISAFGKLEGAWLPAKLNNRNVNYLQMIPINFIYTKYDFDYVELKGSTLYWMIN